MPLTKMDGAPLPEGAEIDFKFGMAHWPKNTDPLCPVILVYAGETKEFLTRLVLDEQDTHSMILWAVDVIRSMTNSQFEDLRLSFGAEHSKLNS